MKSIPLRVIVFSLVLMSGCSAYRSAVRGTQDRTYAVTLPQGWETYISVGDFRVIGEPFYCPNKALGIFPQVRICWQMENLTSEPLYVKVNYDSENPKGVGGTGYGVGYLLPAHEKISIHNAVPVFSALLPMQLEVYVDDLWLPDRRLSPPERHRGLITEPLLVPRSAAGDSMVVDEIGPCPQVKKVRLASSDVLGNVLEITIDNPMKKDCLLGIQTSVGDPLKIDCGSPALNHPRARSKGSFAETEVRVKAHDTSVVQAPYVIPSDAGQKPLLAYRLIDLNAPDGNDAETRLELKEGELALLRRGRNLVAAGSVDLWSAAQKGLVTLPQFVPVEERAKLTAQKHSKHFLFRYRPDSYAALNIDEVIREREEAYDKLKTMLQMDIPVIVTIDLYPDMEAKGLGSGTKWTPANTVNNRHIAEVYDVSYQCDPNHELAHIFTYHFDDHFDIPGEKALCEPFAAYCEADTDIAADTERLKLQLRQGKPSHLQTILSSLSPSDQNQAFIHYLLTRDVAKFRQFYVNATDGAKQEDLDEVSRKIYGTDLAGLERQWHLHLKNQKSKTSKDQPR